MDFEWGSAPSPPSASKAGGDEGAAGIKGKAFDA